MDSTRRIFQNEKKSKDSSDLNKKNKKCIFIFFYIKINLINNLMGLNQSIHKLNFEGMQNILNNNNSRGKFLIINTLGANNQSCLIKNTLSPSRETEEITRLLREDKNINIVIYGENSIDSKVIEKYNQLYKLGFVNLYVYIGGLFEWLLLQDIYGDDEFPTTSKLVDILKYKGKSII